jgi:carotenoid cleavage dioxygenase-like enzyme
MERKTNFRIQSSDKYFQDGIAEGSYKYTRTKAFVEEGKAGKFLFPQ